MNTIAGAKGAAQARRRFGAQQDERPPTALADRPFTLEDLLAGHGAVGLAQAAARQGNRSAREALADLRRTVAAVEADPASGTGGAA